MVATALTACQGAAEEETNLQGNKEQETADIQDAAEEKQTGTEAGSEAELSKERQIAGQTFEVELNSLGSVTFASYKPDVTEDAGADAVFAVLRGDEVLEVLEGMETDNIRTDRTFAAVEAVSFPDYNGDGVKDVIVINSYFMADGSGADTDAEGKASEARIYEGEENGSFILKKELSREANAALAEKTVQSVLGFLGAGVSGEQTAENGWQQAYIDYMKSQQEYEPQGYVLIYLDEDDIPELVRVGNCEADGCRIVSWYEGSIYENQLARLYFSYIERGNLLCNSEGNMDCYYDIVYRLKQGTLDLVAAGYYGTEDNSNVQFDEKGEPIYQYEWEGSKMSREEYQQKLQEVYDTTKAKDGYVWEEINSSEEMTELLEKMCRNGD